MIVLLVRRDTLPPWIGLDRASHESSHRTQPGARPDHRDRSSRLAHWRQTTAIATASGPTARLKKSTSGNKSKCTCVRIADPGLQFITRSDVVLTRVGRLPRARKSEHPRPGGVPDTRAPAPCRRLRFEAG